MEIFYIHGIDPNNQEFEFKKGEEVGEEMKTYFKPYNNVIICVKGNEVGSDYDCLKKIMQIPDNYHIYTHTIIMKALMRIYNKSTHIDINKRLNSVYGNIHISERCEYHQTVYDKYHCALRDSVKTAIMIETVMNEFGIEVENNEELPQVSDDIEIQPNHEILMLFEDVYSDNSPCEVVFMRCVLENYRINQREIVKHIMFGMKNKGMDSERPELDGILFGDDRNDKQFDELYHLGLQYPNALVVNSCSKETCMRIGLPNKRINENVFIAECVKGVYGSNKGVGNIRKNYDENIEKGSYECCEYHKSNAENCCIVKLNRFIDKCNYIINNWDKLNGEYSQSFTSTTSTTSDAE